MKIKIVLLAVCLLTFGSIGLAQKKKTTATIAPDQVVKNLYAAHNANKSPLAQNKNRALVDQYFTKKLADAIWKTSSEGWDFDPLYYAQDTQIANFTISKADADGTVTVKFKNMGKAEQILFYLVKETAQSKVWKIDTIMYSDAEDLGTILSSADMTEAERKEAAEANKMDGDYLVGTVKCTVQTNLSGYWARVMCDDQENLQVIDTETLTFGTFNPKEKGRKGKFVLAEDGSIGKFVDAAGKEAKVTRVK